MDGMMLVRGGRSSSASSTERSLLLGALASHMGVLDARENDAQTIVRKSELWDEITRQFNANTSAPRSRQQIQTLYKNMKAKARRYEARLAEVSSGVPPPDPDPISEMLLGLLHQQMQHQRRHLQRLISVDAHGMMASGEDALNSSQHYDPNIVSPEQVMQVSLREGPTSEMEIKNEPREALGSPDVPPDEGTSPPASVPASPDSRATTPTSKPLALGRSAHLLTAEHYSKALPHAMVHRQQQTRTDGPEGPSAPAGGRLPKPASSPSRASLALPPAAAARPPPPSGDGPTAPDALPAAKKPRVECGTDEILRLGGGCGRLPPRPLAPCCCPDLHSRLVALAQEEHHRRMKVLEGDFELRTKEHAARMRILSLEEEKVRGSLGRSETSNPDEAPPTSSDDATEATEEA